MPLTVDACVAQHLGDRREQQDQVSLFAHPRRAGFMMAALADGMGGHTGGALAAQQVLLKARQNFEAYSPHSETPAQFLAEVLQEAHVVIKLTRFTSEKDPHSTGVVFMLQPGRADWAHCGDSRLYHYRGNRLLHRTADHSLVGEMQRKGQLDDEGALHHPQRNMLLSCLGSERPPTIEHGATSSLEAGDSFLLCSDGLWGYLSDAELGIILSRHSARRAAETLVRLGRERAQGKGDNLSLALIRLVDTEQKA